MSATSIPSGEPIKVRVSPFGHLSSEARETLKAKMADAGWSMRMKGQRLDNPEFQKYNEQFVAVHNQQIVAFGENYSEVLHRAAAECQVPITRVVMSFWGDASTW